MTVNALVAATHLLIPIQSSYFALEGTDDLLETIEKVSARAESDLQILGVVITMHDKRTALARDIRSQIDKVFGSKVFNTVITKSCGSKRARPTRNRSSPSRRNRPARRSTTGCARRSWTVPKRGLPQRCAMRHDEHYVEALTELGRRADRTDDPARPVEPNPNQPRQVMGDIRS